VVRSGLVKSLVGRVFGIVLLGLAGPASAQTPWSAGETTGSALNIKLVTIGPGVPLYAWWGHSGMIVEDRRTGISRFYDYGRFSFKQDHFYRNFAIGRLYFEIGSAPTDAYLEHYRSLDQTVRIQTLDLAPENALELAKLLDRDVAPGNNVYLYDHYYDNCATRLRDILDQFTDGALNLGAADDAGVEFRTETRRFTQHSFFFDFLLTYLMSDSIDAEMSEWETMFLPERLEQHVASLRIGDGRGGTRPLVTETVLYYLSRDGRTIADLPTPFGPSCRCGIWRSRARRISFGRGRYADRQDNPRPSSFDNRSRRRGAGDDALFHEHLHRSYRHLWE